MTASRVFEFSPDYTAAPGETLRQKLIELNITQTDLAARSGLSAKTVNQIIQGVAPLTTETALALERITGTPTAVWSRLESSYREALLRKAEEKLSREDEEWMESLPVRQLIQAGELPASDSPPKLFQSLLAFFGVADRAAWEGLWRRPVASFKRTKAFKSDPGAVASWLRVGQRLAIGIDRQPYDQKAFKAAVQEVRRVTMKADFEALVELCREAGVTVLFVPEIGNSRISGAAWWASPTHAVIQLSDRYKSDDHFWFSFFHEAGHVLLHSKKETFIDDGSEDDEIEEEASRFASNTLIPSSYATVLSTVRTPSQVEALAAELGIAPGIIVGRLQHDHIWPWNRGNQFKKAIHFVEDKEPV